jgi:hypothetical protein
MPLTMRGPAGLHCLLRRLGSWPHLPDPWWSRESALVLVDDRERSDDALGPRADIGGAKEQFQKSWDAWKAWAKLEEVLETKTVILLSLTSSSGSSSPCQLSFQSQSLRVFFPPLSRPQAIWA